MPLPFYRGGALVLNPKCIVFGLVLIALYITGVSVGGELNVQRELFASFVIWVIGYVALAEYDYLYKCQRGAMVKGYGPTSSLKTGGQPARHVRTSTHLKLIYASHLGFAAVMFVASGVLPSWLAPTTWVAPAQILLAGMAALAFAYHSYQLYNVVAHGGAVTYDETHYVSV